MTGHIINPGGTEDKRSLKLETKKRNHIPNEIPPPQSPQSIQSFIDTHSKAHPNALLRSRATAYSCVGMIFAARRTWIDIDHLHLILVDDEYRQLRRFDDAQEGDIVVYYNDSILTHVAVIIKIDINYYNANRTFTVISKWGMTCEWIHEMNDTPELLGNPNEVWTDRR